MLASLFIVCIFAPSYQVGWRSAVHGKSREAEERREELGVRGEAQIGCAAAPAAVLFVAGAHWPVT